MHNSDAISIMNCAFDCPCFFTHEVWKLFHRIRKFSKILYKGRVVNKIIFLIKNELIDNIRQTTAINKIPQERQQRRQRRPSQPGRQRAGPVQAPPAGPAGAPLPPLLPPLWYFIHLLFPLLYILSYI